LLVDSRGNVAGLPAEWQPNAAGRTFAGFGDVMSLAPDKWFEHLKPSPYIGPYFNAGNVMPAAMGVAGDAGVKTARLSWLRVFLIVYVIVVGPIVALALARVRRREWLWAAVPLVSLAFTAGAWFAGRENRDQVVRAHGSMVYLLPGANATVHTYVGTMSHNGGKAKITTPAGWRPTSMNNMNVGNVVGDQSTMRWRDGELSLDLQPGQFGVAAVTGPSTFEGTLHVSGAVAGESEIQGTIRNDTGFVLERVAVFGAGSSTTVADIAVGASANFNLRGAGVQDRIAMMSWPGDDGFRGFNASNTSPSNPGVVTESLQSLGVDLTATGRLVVVGWTREYRPPIEIDGKAPRAGRSAIVAVVPINAGAKLSSVGQRVEAVRTTDFRKGPAVAPAMYAVSQPGADLSGKKLELLVGGTFTAVEIWDGERWLLVRGDLNGNMRAPNFNGALSTVAVPANALIDGVVYVRTRSLGEPIGLRGVPMFLREA
jgi:hypothetical protein